MQNLGIYAQYMSPMGEASSNLANLWANADFDARCKVLGTPKAAGVM